MLIWPICERSIGICIGARSGCDGIAIPGIDCSAGATGFGLAGGAAFFLAAGFGCAGMVMPGMSICA
jgi:hypothetical protein